MSRVGVLALVALLLIVGASGCGTDIAAAAEPSACSFMADGEYAALVGLIRVAEESADRQGITREEVFASLHSQCLSRGAPEECTVCITAAMNAGW